MKYDWEFLHPNMTMEHLGYIPQFLSDSDPRPAREQFNTSYISGWHPFKGSFRIDENNVMHYPGDPPQRPLAQTKLRDELIVFYEHEWVAIIQPDRSYEICRMD